MNQKIKNKEKKMKEKMKEDSKDYNYLFVYHNKNINKFRWFYSNLKSAEGTLYSEPWEGTIKLDENPNWDKLIHLELPINVSDNFTKYIKDIFSYLEYHNQCNPLSISIDDFTDFLSVLNESFMKTLELESVEKLRKEVKEHNPLELEYRMYGLVPYQLSGIQSGIQFGHGVVEYTNLYSDTKEYQKWSKKDKTFIVLNGGTTNSDVNKLGTLNRILGDLQSLGIKYATFSEPDLGDVLTSINFLLDERVWDKEKYPYFEDASAEERTHYLMNIDSSILEAERILEIRHFISNFKLATN